ncbi:MAG: hypothetical protein KC592_13850 [Nitrospira sp.]|nr:hypothetical protein [Nitrospira sp.]
MGAQNPSITVDREATINSEVRIASSEEVIQQVLEALSVEHVYPELMESAPRASTPLQNAVMKVKENLSITQVQGSNVIEISYKHEIPEIAALVVNTLVEKLREQHLRIFSDPKASFLEKQAQDYRAKLKESTSQLEKFKQTHGFSSHAEERRLLLEQRKEMDIILKTVQHEAEGLRTKLIGLKNQEKNIPRRIPLSSVSDEHDLIDKAKSDLLENRRKEKVLLTKYTESSRLVQELREEIQLIEEFIQDQENAISDRITTGTNPMYQQIAMDAMSAENQLKALLAKQETIKQQLADLSTQLAHLNTYERELETLELGVTTARQNYDQYLKKVEEARISEEMDQLKMANISVIQPASIPIHPIKPKKMLNIMMGFIVGLVAGFGAAFSSEYLRGAYSRPEQLGRDLGLPILVSVAHKRA